jgi:hypothetical protein
MANVKISELPAASTLTGTEVVPVVQGATARKTTAAAIAGLAPAYTLPTASTTILGGVKVDGTTVTIADGVISAETGSSTLDGLTDVTITAPESGQVLTHDGSGWVNATPASGGGGGATVLDRNSTLDDISWTSAETATYSYTLPGGTLGTNKIARLILFYDLAFGGGGTYTVKVKFGGTTIHETGALAPSSQSARRYGRLEVNLAGAGATNAQVSTAMLDLGISAATTQIGVNASYFGGYGIAAPAIDSTVDQVLTVTVQFSVGHSANSWRRRLVTLELLG